MVEQTPSPRIHHAAPSLWRMALDCVRDPFHFFGKRDVLQEAAEIFYMPEIAYANQVQEVQGAHMMRNYCMLGAAVVGTIVVVGLTGAMQFNLGKEALEVLERTAELITGSTASDGKDAVYKGLALTVGYAALQVLLLPGRSMKMNSETAHVIRALYPDLAPVFDVWDKTFLAPLPREKLDGEGIDDRIQMMKDLKSQLDAARVICS